MRPEAPRNPAGRGREGAGPDIDRAAAFYGGLFGWTFEKGGEEVGGYGMFQLGGRTVAGGMAVPADKGAAAWNVYFQSPDADATAKAVERGGGTVTFQPMDVMDFGRGAYFTDPAGAGFSTWQPGRNKGLDATSEANTLCWVELYAPDVDAAKAFYGSVFGWRTTDVSFPGGTYTTVNPAEGDDDSMFGGLVPIADASRRQGRTSWPIRSAGGSPSSRARRRRRHETGRAAVIGQTQCDTK